MTEQIVYLTPEGKADLEAKLDFLRTTRRREVAERIRGAKDDGDISESGEYEDAKREQAFLEGEIRSIEQTLRYGRVIENNGTTETVGVGRTVTVRDSEGVEEKWRIVSPAEANPRQRKISTASPIGAALIGRKVGDNVPVETLAGHIEYPYSRSINGAADMWRAGSASPAPSFVWPVFRRHSTTMPRARSASHISAGVIQARQSSRPAAIWPSR